MGKRRRMRHWVAAVVGCGLSSAPTGAQTRSGFGAAPNASLRTGMGVGEPREAGFTWVGGLGGGGDRPFTFVKDKL